MIVAKGGKTDLGYEWLISVASNCLSNYKNVAKHTDITYEPTDVVADAWILMADGNYELTKPNFIQCVKKAITLNARSFDDANPFHKEQRLLSLSVWKKQNPEKIKEYCKRHSKEFTERAKKWQLQNPERWKAIKRKYNESIKERRKMSNFSIQQRVAYNNYQKRYRDKKSEAYLTAQRNSRDKKTSTLADSYVRGILKGEGKTNITPEMIEDRRVIIIQRRLQRELKQMKQ